MKAPGHRGPLGRALGCAAAVVGLLIYAAEIWQEYRFVAVLAAIGAVGFAAAGLYFLLAAHAHSGTELDVQSAGSPGGKLVAVLRAPGLRGARKLKATLAWKEVEATPVYSDEANEEKIVWSREASFAVSPRAGSGGSECRIEFEIPAHAKQSDVELRFSGEAKRSGTMWELSVHAQGAGTELKRAFVVPVGPQRAGKMAG